MGCDKIVTIDRLKAGGEFRLSVGALGETPEETTPSTTMKKTIASLFIASATLMSAHATLLITEVQSNQNFVSGEDFWELTNFGASAVDLAGFTYDDSTADPSLGFTFAGPLSIAPGQSIVFVEDMTPTAFRDWWGIGPSTEVVTFSGSGLGLGGGDAVNLFDASNNLVASFNYAAAGFTLSNGDPSLGGHAGLSAGGAEVYFSAVWDPTSGIVSPRYTFAVAGQNGAFAAATGLDVGSPGVVPEPGTIAMIGLGLAAVLYGMRRRRTA